MINLLPPRYIKQRHLNTKKVIITIIVGAIILVILLTYFNLLFENKKEEEKLKLVERKLKEVNNRLEETIKLKKSYKEIQDEFNQKEKLVGNRLPLSLILEMLGAIIPQQSWINDFNLYNHNRFKLAGYTLKRQELKLIVNRLQGSSLVNDLAIDFVEIKELYQKNNKKIELIYYQISGVIDEGEKDGWN